MQQLEIWPQRPRYQLPPLPGTMQGVGWHVSERVAYSWGVDFGPYLVNGWQGAVWHLWGEVKQRSRCWWNHWRSNTTWHLFFKGSEVKTQTSATQKLIARKVHWGRCERRGQPFGRKPRLLPNQIHSRDHPSLPCYAACGASLIEKSFDWRRLFLVWFISSEMSEHLWRVIWLFSWRPRSASSLALNESPCSLDDD